MIYLFSCWFTDYEGKRRHIEVKTESREEADKQFKVMQIDSFLSKEIYCLPIPKGY